MNIEDLHARIKKCRICVDAPQGEPLPHQPRPVAVLSKNAKLMIVGQAPGTRVHASGKPFTDPSGDRLRDWMGVDCNVFYDPNKLAIAPMGFCFPGLDAKGGDLPPRKECSQQWQSQVLEAMPQVELILLIGMYAQKFHMHEEAKKTLTETVYNWRTVFNESQNPKLLPLPHPSWRNNGWIRKNPWFLDDLIPELRKEVARLV
jgi:uracil-DNA glycosylase